MITAPRHEWVLWRHETKGWRSDYVTVYRTDDQRAYIIKAGLKVFVERLTTGRWRQIV